MCDAPMALDNEEATSYLLGIRTAHVKDGSNSCACFGWDTQACIHATGKRDVTSKWVRKYTSDLERSSLFNSTKNRGTASNESFSNPWVRQLQLDQGCISQIFTLKQFSSENGSPLCLRLATNFCQQMCPIDLTFFLSCQKINFDCLCDQLLVRNSL